MLIWRFIVFYFRETLRNKFSSNFPFELTESIVINSIVCFMPHSPHSPYKLVFTKAKVVAKSFRLPKAYQSLILFPGQPAHNVSLLLSSSCVLSEADFFGSIFAAHFSDYPSPKKGYILYNHLSDYYYFIFIFF